MDYFYLVIWVLLFVGIWYGTVKLATPKLKKPWIGHLIGAPLGLVISGVLVAPLLKTNSVGATSSDEIAWTAARPTEQQAAEIALKARSDKLSAARGACMLILKELLNDPYSADFGMTSDWFVKEKEDGTILVRPVVRAKNSFGAYIKGTWSCVTKKEGADIRVLSLKQMHP